MFGLVTALSNQPLPKGRRVAILTNAGGPSILCADACEGAGLVVPELSEGTKKLLAAFLPPPATIKNPVDLIASATPEQYRSAIETLMSAEEINAIIVLYIVLTAKGTGPIAEAIVGGVAAARAKGATQKPALICWMAEGDPERGFSVGNERIPVYASPELPARALGKVAAYQEWRTRPAAMIPDFDDVDLDQAKEVCARALRDRGPGWLTVTETRGVLGAMRLALPAGGVAGTPEEAVAIARTLGFPVAVKLASHQIVHKTEVGGVILNLESAEAVRDAYHAIEQRLASSGHAGAMEGVLVQPMFSEGVELLIGVTQDPLFGPLIAFGLGGIHVEVLGDVSFRINPLTDRDAREMIEGIRGYRLLEGYRGRAPADIDALQEALLRVSRLVEAIADISELDLNPLFALPRGKGYVIADARIRIGV